MEKQRLNNRADVFVGGSSNSDEISSAKYGGGMILKNVQRAADEAVLSGKNIFTYVGNSGRDNVSHSFNYSDYS